MWEDLKRAKEIIGTCDVIATNVSAMFIPEARHIYSMHAQQISAISRFRKHEYADQNAVTHSIKLLDDIDYMWKLTGIVSTSGLAAALLAKLLGYRKIVLAGVPMDASGYFYKPTFNEAFPDRCRGLEMQSMKNLLGGSVKSMSGRTREAFGEPSQAWVNEEVSCGNTK